MKTIILLSLMTLSAGASVVKRPDYIPDENHPAPVKVQVPRQAEEERPKESRDEWKEEREQRNQKNEIKKRLP